MVRVINVHNFLQQNVHSVDDEPVATAVTAHNSHLLLATAANTIQVYDLQATPPQLPPLHTQHYTSFPTVDDVIQIVHCTFGNYIATLETKSSTPSPNCHKRQKGHVVRVYTNWMPSNGSGRCPQFGNTDSVTSARLIRARIAGRVTPTTAANTLEMTELPTLDDRNPQQITCCQASGNLLVQSGNNMLDIYLLKMRTHHHLSTMTFIDFELAPFSIVTPFAATILGFCENYVACLSATCVYAFRIIDRHHRLKHAETSPRVEDDSSQQLTADDTNDCIDFDQLSNGSNVNHTVHLPTIVNENSAIYKHCPYTYYDGRLQATLKYHHQHSSAMGKTSVRDAYSVEHLLQLRLSQIIVENSHRQLTETFKCLTLKGMYVEEAFLRTTAGGAICRRHSCTLLSSALYSAHFYGVICMLATLQDGYCYHFRDDFGWYTTSHP